MLMVNPDTTLTRSSTPSFYAQTSPSYCFPHITCLQYSKETDTVFGYSTCWKDFSWNFLSLMNKVHCAPLWAVWRYGFPASAFKSAGEQLTHRIQVSWKGREIMYHNWQQLTTQLQQQQHTPTEEWGPCVFTGHLDWFYMSGFTLVSSITANHPAMKTIPAWLSKCFHK